MCNVFYNNKKITLVVIKKPKDSTKSFISVRMYPDILIS